MAEEKRQLPPTLHSGNPLEIAGKQITDQKGREQREAVMSRATVRGWHQRSPSPSPPLPRGESLQSLCQSPGGWPALEVTFTNGDGFRLLLLGPSRFYLKIAVFLGRSEKSMDPCKPQTSKKSKHKKLGELTTESDSPYAAECGCYEVRASEKVHQEGVHKRTDWTSDKRRLK